MSCTLTVVFNTPGYNDGSDTASFTVPNGTYISPYIQTRPDLGYNGTDNNVYSLFCGGSQGILSLGTFYPGSIKVSIRSASNSCQEEEGTYDCVNGKCVKNIDGLGLFKSLEDCEALCSFSCETGKKCVDSNYCPPGKVCLESQEYSEIQALISKVRSEKCSR